MKIKSTPKSKSVPAKKGGEDPIKEEAVQAVQEYSDKRAQLEEMREEFNQQFPEAAAELEAINLTKDKVVELIAIAKDKVRACKESIGDFKLTRKFSSACYDPDKVLSIISEAGDWEMFKDLQQAGALKTIVLDQKLFSLFLDHDGRAPSYKVAWKDREEMTPSVGVPKL